jgi:hypothetical protein
MERKHFDGDEFRGNRLRIMGTDQDDPEEGRIFVWTKEGWFERVEGSSGAVAFSHFADSEDELRRLVSQDDASAELVNLGGEIKHTVGEEFVEQYRSYLDAASSSSDEPEDEDEGQEFHQHDVK